jgi:hypothetical protein
VPVKSAASSLAVGLQAVADEVGEADFEAGAFAQRAQRGVFGRVDVAALAGLEQLEGDADDVRVFGRELAGLRVGEVVAAAQRPAGDLFAEQLRAEGAQAHDVGDGVGVPAFAEHGDGDHATDVRTEGVGFADGVDDFAQQVGVGEAVDAALGVAQAVGALEALDLGRENLLEAFVDLAGVFEGVAVDEQRRRAGQRAAGVAVEIGEQRETAGNDGGLAAFIDAFVAGDFLEHFARNGGVAADDDEDRRRGEQVGLELAFLRRPRSYSS